LRSPKRKWINGSLFFSRRMPTSCKRNGKKPNGPMLMTNKNAEG
jgi:hypothetical protein